LTQDGRSPIMNSTFVIGDFFMSEEQKEKQCLQNMQNPDFLWEIPKNGSEQHLVQQVQEVGRSGEDTASNKDLEK